MQRRQFLQGSFGLATGAWLSHALPTQAMPSSSPADVLRTGFTNATERPLRRLRTQGQLPPSLRGRFYRNGPALHAFNGVRYHHWFDGDGMVQQFRLTDEGVWHQSRFVQTDKWQAEQRAGRRLRMGFGSTVPNQEPVSSAQALSTANTNILQLPEGLLALWEGGSPYVLDPETLATRGESQTTSPWHGLAFSAHPRVLHNGEVWNFGVNYLGRSLLIYRLNIHGERLGFGQIPLPFTPFVHDFWVTKHFLIFLLPPLAFQLEKAQAGFSFINAHTWEPERGLTALIIPKDDWQKPRWVDLPCGFVFHGGNAWEEADGSVCFDYAHYTDARIVSEHLHKDFSDKTERYTEFSANLAWVRIAPQASTATPVYSKVSAEFQRVDPRHIGNACRVFHLSRTAQHPHFGFHQVLCHDVKQGVIAYYDYGVDWVVEEHVPVPKAADASVNAVWLIGTALDLHAGVSVLSVLDGENLAAGPIYQAWLDHVLPFGFHGQFYGQS